MLKPLSALLALLLCSTCIYAQSMRVKKHNYTSFATDSKNVPDALNHYSSAVAKQHPEYGILPPHTPCQSCVELIDKRTIDSRQYMDPQQPGRTFSQRSYFPLHYKKGTDDVWHSIDERLRPSSTPGVFIADRQPVPTKSDINRKSTSVIMGSVEFEFNKNVSVYFVDGNNAQSAVQQSDYSHYTAGSDGVMIKDIWTGIDMEQTFTFSEVKSTYVINEPMDIPVSNGYMVIEDHFALPAGYTFNEAQGVHTADGYYQGDYEVRDPQGRALGTYHVPAYYDAKVWGIQGSYQLLQIGNSYTLRMLVPLSWINNPDNVYPLYIDPTFDGRKSLGNFYLTGGQFANFAFTTMALGSCDYDMDSVKVDGKSKITNSYVNLEYRLTYDPMCGTPPLPAPFCTFSQVSMEVISRDCNKTTGLLACNPAQPPYTGTCTTDPNLVPGAGPIQINAFQPSFLTCIAPQCPDYYLDFTLKNRDSTCGAACSYLCANGTMWEMIIEACTVEGNQTQDKTQVCAGETVTFTAHPTCGVPPYTYIWTKDGGNTFDTTTVPNYLVTPQTGGVTFNVACYIVDACGVMATTNDLSVQVTSSPTADAGPDQTTCLGGPVTLGGNPTTTNGTSITWTGSTPTVQSWLSSNSHPNPTANVAAGTIDTFFYVVRISNGGTCIRRDTVYVYSTDGPITNAGADLNLCGGGTATLGGTPAASPGYNIEWAGYGNANANSWLSNPNTANPTVSIPAGTVDTVYYLIQVFSNQCSRRDTMTIFLPQAPLANAGTDVNLCAGGTATLGGTPAAGPGTTIAWSSNDATAATWLSSTTLANPQLNVPSGTLGSYQYYLTVTDPSCNRHDTVLVNSYANPVAVVDTSGPTTICSNTTLTLSVAGNYAAYAWNNGEITQSIEVGTAGNYYVMVTDANGCTDTSNIITITTIAAPDITVYPDTSINYGDSLALYTDLNLASVDSFIWYPSVNISCTDCPNPTVAPESDTYYGVQVYANGCPATDSALIKIILKNNFYLPNAFTPNGDGNNDDFYILAQRGVKVIEFQIYNRIGEKIHDGLYPWDGNYKGKPCQPGTYVYVVRMGLFGEQQGLLRKGSVTLIR